MATHRRRHVGARLGGRADHYQGVRAIVAISFVVLLAAACTNATETDGQTGTSVPPTGVTVANRCSDGDVGTDPPASVRFVGETEQVVPFQSWGCPGYYADSFVDPADYPVMSDAGGVDVFFVSGSATGVSAVAWTTATSGQNTNLVPERIGKGHIQLSVPDPGLAWVIRVRLTTPDEWNAHYDALVEPPATTDAGSDPSGLIEIRSGSGRLLDCPSEQWQLGTADILADSIGSETAQAALSLLTPELGLPPGTPQIESETTDQVVFLFTDPAGHRFGRVGVGHFENGWFNTWNERCG